MYTNLSQPPELSDLTPTERQRVLALALNCLSPLQKIALNVIKLLILTPLFFIMAGHFNWWWLLPGTLLILMLFSLICRPIQIALARPHFRKVIQEHLQREQKTGS